MAISGTPSEAPAQAAPAAERRSEKVPEPTPPPASTAPPVALPGQSSEPMAAELEPVDLPAIEPQQSPPATVQPDGELDLTAIRRMWPDVMAAVSVMKKTTWSLLKNASVIDLDAGRLTLGFSTSGLRDAFVGRSDHQDYVREALIQVLGVDWKVEAIVDPSVAQSGLGAPDPDEPAQRREGAARPTQRNAAPAGDDAPSADDPDAEDAGLTSHDLLARELGAKVIGEYDNS
jgi:DNA polymerase-3 subunit gamma/tau